MRTHVEITAAGKTLAEIAKLLTIEWQRLVGDSSATLPYDAEIMIKGGDTSETYEAKCVVRAKIES